MTARVVAAGWVVARWVVALTTASVLCGACGGDGTAAVDAEPSSPAFGIEVRPGVRVALTAPEVGKGSAVVVLVPGGAYVSADPSGMRPLADALAAQGAAVGMLTYRTASDGVSFPTPVEDIECGIASVVEAAADLVEEDADVVVVGHSAGAHLSAVAALDPRTTQDRDCPAPPAPVDRFVGLAGPYDVVSAAFLVAPLFGPENPGPDQWGDGDPLRLADRRPDLPALLVHGSSDGLVPASHSEALATALSDAGHPVTLHVLDDVDHDTVYSAEVAAPLIATWLGLARGG